MRKIFNFLILLSIFHSSEILSQNLFGLLSEGEDITSLGFGANPHMDAGLDFMDISKKSENPIERYGFFFSFSMPVFTSDGLDYDLKLGVCALIRHKKQFKSITGITWNFSRTEDINGRYFHSGIKWEILPGQYGKKWAAAPHFGIHYQPFLNVRQKDYGSRTFENLKQNSISEVQKSDISWHLQNYLRFELGLGIAHYDQNYNFNLIGGYSHLRNEPGLIALPELGILPFYSRVNLGYSKKPNEAWIEFPWKKQ